MKFVISFCVMSVVAVVGWVGGSVNTSVPGWFSFSQVEATPYRRSVRRTARRTSRRTATRHSYYGGAAVVGAVAIGTMVVSLPPACSRVVVNGVAYHNCSGTYYAPSGSQYVVVEAP